MSLIDRINRNTTAVLSGKQSIEIAIKEKGGDVGNYIGAPNFVSLVEGINDIVSVNDIVGNEEKVAVATENITKGEMCSLINPPAGSFEAMETRSFPTTAKNGGVIVALTGEPIKLDNEGKLIVLQSAESTTTGYYYPFCWVDGEYVQMTYKGEYQKLGDYTSNGASTCYDVVTNNLFWTVSARVDALHIDFETLNISFLVAGPNVTGLSSTDIARGCQMAYNNHFIVRVETSAYDSLKMYRYDPTANTITLIANMLNGGIVSYGNPYYATVRSFVGYEDSLYVFIFTKSSSSSKTSRIALLKFTMNNDTGSYVFLNQFWKDKCSPGVKGLWDYKAQMNIDASLILFIDYTDNLLHGFKIDKTLMTGTEMTFTFNDGLDTATIDALALVRNTNFVYVRTADTTYAEAERVRLYEYNINTGVCTFVSCPTQSFAPSVLANEMPRQNNLIDSKYTIYQKADSTYAMYKVGYATREYDVIATPCNNTLVDGVDGYGIAKEDIAMGSMGSAIVILK